MNPEAFLVRRIAQKDNHTFFIEWGDGLIADYKLCDLQRNCPCAGCNDEVTGKKLIDEKSISNDVRAVRLQNIGRYALRVQFSSGCSNGIYGFDFLRKLAGAGS